jgi:hypothetical protein
LKVISIFVGWVGRQRRQISDPEISKGSNLIVIPFLLKEGRTGCDKQGDTDQNKEG